MVKERGNAVSRLNHSSSSSGMASSTQPRPVIEGTGGTVKAILDAHSGRRQGKSSLLLAPM